MIRATVKLGSALQSVVSDIATDDGDTTHSLKESSEFDWLTSTDITIADLIGKLGMPDDQRLLVIIDDAVIPASRYDSHLLTDGCKVSLMPPIHAG